ncbi:hypothetical protein FVQ98_07030 [Ottowia sp. GY511]|uniref:Response regulatory domain-containing protein n=1 Tax=Ottowia flava TaxID=2675430 RepID=A0ABW4KT15_9BURK|nr:hypothetical protein [Ottowia sp. GY511]TXK31034.1 hypothetical protein FVQ98_07030 [Ottowia sp. GY511]
MTHTYVFIGLTPSERSLLASIFALDADEGPGDALVPVGLDEAASAPDLLIVNGDDLAVAQRLSEAYPRALLVLVGEPRGAQAVRWPVMRRPLDLQGAVAVLSALDWPEPESGAPLPAPTQDDMGQDSVHAAPVTRPPSTAFPSEAMSSAFAPTTASAPLLSGSAPPPTQPLSARLAWAMSELEPPDAAPALRARPSPAEEPPRPPVRPADVLVVHARRGGQSPSLARGLRRMGYAVKAVNSPDQALTEMAHQPALFVFLDQASLGAQLLPLARALNALRTAPTQPPHLAVVARRGSPLDRLRVRLAGCAWMPVPINRDRLAEYLERRGLPRPTDNPSPGARGKMH